MYNSKFLGCVEEDAELTIRHYVHANATSHTTTSGTTIATFSTAYNYNNC